jgi:hypothetical protein
MDRNDQQAIEALFDKLAAVERNAPPRDPRLKPISVKGLHGSPLLPITWPKL